MRLLFLYIRKSVYIENVSNLTFLFTRCPPGKPSIVHENVLLFSSNQTLTTRFRCWTHHDRMAVYLETTAITIICFLLQFLPFSVGQGKNYRWWTIVLRGALHFIFLPTLLLPAVGTRILFINESINFCCSWLSCLNVLSCKESERNSLTPLIKILM